MAQATPDDLRHMRHALALASRALGRTASNPAVGCVIVSSDGRILGRGWTGDGGRPHAETVALAQAGAGARGATAYVSLEPCAHHGRTPPCAEALAKAGIARVVAAVEDPDPRVQGRGLARLRKAGIDVLTNTLAEDAARLNEGFFSRVTRARPLVILKIAQSLDGRTASASGESRWITSEPARRLGHLMRARHDAILVGSGTALVDDPSLTCRLPGLETASPLRVVLDSRLRLPVASRLARTARQGPVLLFTAAGHDAGPLTACGVEVVGVATDAAGRVDLAAVLKGLAERGIGRLLVEGGATVHAAFLDRGLADRLELFTAPVALGAAGTGAIAALAEAGLGESPRFVREHCRTVGPDLLESYAVKA